MVKCNKLGTFSLGGLNLIIITMSNNDYIILLKNHFSHFDNDTVAAISL